MSDGEGGHKFPHLAKSLLPAVQNGVPCGCKR